MIDADSAIQWLLASKDPSIRYWTLVDLLDKPSRSRPVREAHKEIPNGPRVRALLRGQGSAKGRLTRQFASHPGGFGVHPYQKWYGAHWRLVSLVELGIPRTDARARAAVDQVLEWLTSDEHRSHIRMIDGRTRRCASQEGNALAVCCRLGMVDDPRVQYLADSLFEWQWNDGGWNCDKNPSAHHSSFYESLVPFWGLVEYHRVTQDKRAYQAAEQAAELFLCHRLFRSDRTGEVINPEWLKLHYPLYWHYDVLQALVVLGRFGKLGDERAHEALDIVEGKRRSDGKWQPGAYYWRPFGKAPSNTDVADWGRGGPNEMITLNALRVLKAAGRLT